MNQTTMLMLLHIHVPTTLIMELSYIYMVGIVLILNDDTVNHIVLLVRNTKNHDAEISYFVKMLAFCKCPPYFAHGYYEHLCHLYVNCAFNFDKIWYFSLNKRNTWHFEAYYLYFASRFQQSLVGRAVWHSLPPINHSVCPKSVVRVPLVPWKLFYFSKCMVAFPVLKSWEARHVLPLMICYLMIPGWLKTFKAKFCLETFYRFWAVQDNKYWNLTVFTVEDEKQCLL